MDLDKYIGENIDDILDNPYEFVIDKSNNNENNKKKVIFSKDTDFEHMLLKNSNDLDWDEREYLEYNHEYFENDENDENNENDENDENDEYNKEEKEYEKEPNEDDYTEDVIGELYQTMYETNIHKTNIVDVFKNISQSDLNKITNGEYFEDDEKFNGTSGFEKNNLISQTDEKVFNEFENDDGYYFFNLINIFTKYYNNKYDKIGHFFSDIKDLEKGTSSQMELFLDAAIEYKIVKEHFGVNNDECMGMIFSDSTDSEKTLELFEKWDKQIYMFEYGTIRLVSPALFICLNYIYQNGYQDSEWNIYNLRNIS